MRSTEQNFLSPNALGLGRRDYDALISVMGDLERGELKDFNMCSWGTCIYGQCRRKGAFKIGSHDVFKTLPEATFRVFIPGSGIDYDKITQPIAAQALRNYLVYGEPDWKSLIPKWKIGVETALQRLNLSRLWRNAPMREEVI